MYQIKQPLKMHKTDNNINPILVKAMSDLIKEKYEHLATIGSGSFGQIVRVRTSDTRIELAAKIMLPHMTSKGELFIWPHLKHPNILPLLEKIHDPKLDIFLMPFHSKDLWQFMKNRCFRLHPRKFHFAKLWLKDILNGLQYLHEMEVCHLDLKVDNVLITSKMVAVICDFSFVNTTINRVDSYGLPPFLKPPEACTSLGKGPSVDGIAFDMWSFGMLTFDALTCYEFVRKMKTDEMHLHNYDGPLAKRNYWDECVYPFLCDALKPSNFRILVEKTFPMAFNKITPVLEALNLIHCTLRLRPEDRPVTSQLQRHIFISGDSENAGILEADSIWIQRVDSDAENRQICSNSNCYPGQCFLKNGLKSCLCPEGYYSDKRICKEFQWNCRFNDCKPGRCIKEFAVEKCLCPEGFTAKAGRCKEITYTSGRQVSTIMLMIIVAIATVMLTTFLGICICYFNRQNSYL